MSSQPDQVQKKKSITAKQMIFILLGLIIICLIFVAIIGKSTPPATIIPSKVAAIASVTSASENTATSTVILESTIQPSPTIVATDTSLPSDTPIPATETAPAKLQIYKIGDIIPIGDLTMVVNKLSFSNGNELFKPDAGKKYAIVDVTFENKGSSSASLSTMLQMSLKDDTSQAYSVDLMADAVSGGKSPDGELAAGEKLRGQVGFQVPNAAKGFQFVFDASLFEYGRIFVDLGQ
jgi:hypothetical protein